MRGWSVALCLVVAGACSVAAGVVADTGGGGGARRSRSVGPARSAAAAAAATRSAGDADRWLNLVAEYTRGSGNRVNSAASATGASVPYGVGVGAGAAGAWGSWFPSPMALQLPSQAESGGRTSVLLVPVPVPVPAPALPDPAQCQLNTLQTSAPSPGNANTPSNAPPYNAVPVNTQVPTSYPVPAYVPRDSRPAPPPPPATAPAPPHYEPSAADETPPPPPPPRRTPPRRPLTDQRLAGNALKFPPIEDTRLLVEQFRAQAPTDPMLPPVVIDPVGVVSTEDYTEEEIKIQKRSVQNSVHNDQLDEFAESLADNSLDSSGAPDGSGSELRRGRRLKCKRRRFDAEEPELSAPVPPLPRFERSLFLRARLTVPRADYTEPYSVWWDAASGSSRVDFHGGTTSTYRMMDGNGRVRSVRVSVDRTGETDVRRCWVLAPRRVSLAERALPALPDLRAFSFAGHVRQGAQRAELWRHVLSGHSGELGGARGEALTFRHELLVTRAPDNYTTTPLWYSVRVDSSMLGADCDGHVHYYDEIQTRHHDTAMFQLDVADACDQVEVTSRIEHVEPLREFTMLQRDPRYDSELEQYKRRYERDYADFLEEAVRKNLMIQSSRYTTSGNREGASFEMDINFLSDRLKVEQQVLLGVVPAESAAPGEQFPHSRAELDAKRGRQPRKFDWRERGGVTPVRNQLTCASCWAFATVGALEGALFVESGRLVPLSEQALVDCAQPYGGGGCSGTWPTFAYNYMQDVGLPALDEYTPYQGKVLQCRADSVPPVATISGHLNVTQDNIVALKMAIKKYGPTVVIIDGEATSFINYKRGFYSDARCRRNSHNHAVLAVGWTVRRGETYFILKNSWTTAWGDAGYALMRASINTCGVLARPSVPRLRARDVLRVPATAPAAP